MGLRPGSPARQADFRDLSCLFRFLVIGSQQLLKVGRDLAFPCNAKYSSCGETNSLATVPVGAVISCMTYAWASMLRSVPFMRA